MSYSFPDASQLELLQSPHAIGHLTTHNIVTAVLYQHRNCHGPFGEVRKQHYSAAAGGKSDLN